MISFLILMTLFAVPADATQPLDGLCQAAPRGSIVKTTFTQKKTISGLPKPLTSTGEMFLWNGKGLLWITKTPFSNTILLNKEGIFRIDQGVKQSLMEGQQQDQVILNLFTKLLNGTFSQITEFKVNLLTLPQKGKPWKIELIPSGGIAKLISSVEVMGTKFITHISIRRINGDRDDIAFQNQKFEKELPKSIRDMFDE